MVRANIRSDNACGASFPVRTQVAERCPMLRTLRLAVSAALPDASAQPKPPERASFVTRLAPINLIGSEHIRTRPRNKRILTCNSAGEAKDGPDLASNRAASTKAMYDFGSAKSAPFWAE